MSGLLEPPHLNVALRACLGALHHLTPDERVSVMERLVRWYLPDGSYRDRIEPSLHVGDIQQGLPGWDYPSKQPVRGEPLLDPCPACGGSGRLRPPTLAKCRGEPCGECKGSGADPSPARCPEVNNGRRCFACGS